MQKTKRTGAVSPESLSVEEFTAVAYGELRRIAASYFRNEKAEHTLQPTALVHEVYIRLMKGQPKTYENRAHFFSAAARAMRQILVEHARTRGARKRSAGVRVPFESVEIAGDETPDYLAIHSALEHLEKINPRSANVAELRIFAGLSEKDTAEALGVSPATVRGYWREARALLEKHLTHS